MTAPYEDDGPAARTRDAVTHVVTGVLRRDKAVSDVYPDLSLLKNHPGSIFARMPFVSSAVLFRLYVSSTETRIHHGNLNDEGEARKMNVVRSSWLPRRHTVELMQEIYSEESLSWTPEAKAAFDQGGVERLATAHPESLGLRLLILHRSIRTLCQARDCDSDPPFPLQSVLALSDAKVRYAADLKKTDPFRLCFRGAHGLELPDMRPDTIRPTPMQHAAQRFYAKVKKETYEECHSLVDSKGKIDDEALSWLIGNGVLERSLSDPNLVSLVEVARQESALLEALALIEASAPTDAATDEGTPQLGSGKKLCSEQELALTILLRKPILAIDGSAGSGKTDFLHVLSQLYGDRVYCTAFQGVNAGQLTRISSKVSTTHRLLHDHARNHSPFKCLLKGIEVLVVDEVGTQSLTLLAGLLSAFAVCGASNKKLVLVGDLGQLPPIGGPAPFRYLIDYFNARGYLARFYHNHRVDDDDVGAGLIATNASAIRSGEAEGVIWDHENFVMSPLRRNEDPEKTLMRAIERFDLAEASFIVVTHQRKHVEQLCKSLERKFGGSGLPGVQVPHKFAFTKNDYAIGTINNRILRLEAIEDRAVKEPRPARNVTFKRARPSQAHSTTDRRPPNTERYLITCDTEGVRREVLYDGAIVGRIKKASAVTSNAMQGGSCETVVRVDFGPSQYSSRERLYTDVTRATRRFIYVGKLEWFKEAVARPETIPRSQLDERAMALIEGGRPRGGGSVSSSSSSSHKRKRAINV